MRLRPFALPAVCALLIGVATLCVVGFRAGWFRMPPALMATVVALASAACVAEAVAIVVARRRGGIGRVRAAAGIAIVAGVLAVCGGGLANWLLSLQGAVVLTEGESVILSRTGQLQEFEAGPLSDLDEMRLALRLVEVELVAKEGGFVPRSTLVMQRGHGEGHRFSVEPRSSHRRDALWFHQGAFGFSPRIVIFEGERTVFDRPVPFLTRRQGSAGTSFVGSFEVGAESLAVDGEISLDTLDQTMRGHSTLNLRVRRGSRLLGQGSLLPGHFAEIDGGYRIGFAGLKKWTELDVSRRNYPEPMIAGGAVSLAGLLVWPFAAWRRW
jgi:hypothetical protein